MIRERFQAYEHRIAAGIAGEGSDCLGYFDHISRDHDFGTGVCLWLTEEDYDRIGSVLSIAYHELAERHPGESALTDRLRERRGVMTTRTFYSNILGIDCDTASGGLTEEQWFTLDHTCLATAVNGAVFRDDLGEFTRFREMLLRYYPDSVWKVRLMEELHFYASSIQINYARCMSRGDLVAAETCRLRGLESAMQLFFLLKRVYPPYYKWTYRALAELDETGRFACLIRELAGTGSDLSAWEGKQYHPDVLNLEDRVVVLAEEIAEEILAGLRRLGLTRGMDPYLERYCDEIRRSFRGQR